MKDFNVATIRQDMVQIYKNAVRFQWPHDFILEAFKKYREPYMHRKWHQVMLSGMQEILMAMLWQQVVFSYEIGGTRYALSDPEYREYDPQFVNSFALTGCYIWKEQPRKPFTTPVKTVEV